MTRNDNALGTWGETAWGAEAAKRAVRGFQKARFERRTLGTGEAGRRVHSPCPNMTRRRCLRGALHNYLGTLTSRYADFDGYWVLGLIVDDLGDAATFDLLADSNVDAPSAALAAFIRMARTKFREQIDKQRIPASCVRAARLEISKPATQTEGWVNGHVMPGYAVSFSARVESDLHTLYETRMSIFVAPHNAEIETRSKHRER